MDREQKLIVYSEATRFPKPEPIEDTEVTSLGPDVISKAHDFAGIGEWRRINSEELPGLETSTVTELQLRVLESLLIRLDLHRREFPPLNEGITSLMVTEVEEYLKAAPFQVDDQNEAAKKIVENFSPL